ncbi:MAG: hypothetical protein AB7I19_12225 [Planctomycetota bacterium]
MPIAALALVALAQGDPTPDLVLGAERAMRNSVVVAMPWPRGMHAEIDAVQVGSGIGSAQTLLRWPDGSVQVSLLHVRWEGETNLPERATVEVVEGEDAAAIVRRVRATEFGFAAQPQFVCRLRDPFGQELTATLAFGIDRDDATAREIRVPLSRTGGDGPEQLFQVRAWLREYRGSADAELTILLENDPTDEEVVCGPSRYRSFELSVSDPAIEVSVPHGAVLGIGEVVRGEGGFVVALVPDGPAHYLGDHTGKAFRLELRRKSEKAFGPGPLTALPETRWVRHTRAFGSFGGPAPDETTDTRNATALLTAFADRGSHGGPYDAYGDAKDPTYDPSRSAPSLLHSVLRWRSVAMLELAGLAVAQHCLRPTPFTTPRLPATAAHLRAGLGPIAIAKPHAFVALDYEHFAVDLLFDRYWLTGDPLARHELRRAGRKLLDGLTRVEFRTSRGEGLALRSGVAIARATADPELLAGLHRHARDVLLPLIAAAPRGCAIPQPPHERAMGPHEPFDSTEQMAVLALGCMALADAVGDTDVRSAASDLIFRIATDGWMDNHGPAGFISAREYRERSEPAGDAARTGLVGVLLTAFTLAVELESEPARSALIQTRLSELWADRALPGGDATLADPWFQVPLDRR